MAFDLVDIAQNPSLPLTQEGYFSEDYLRYIYLNKISRSRATGKDGIRLAKFQESLTEEIQLISRKILSKNYNFTAYKERLILKGHDKFPRQISIPTARDRLALRALCELLHRAVPNATNRTPHSIIQDIAVAVQHAPVESDFLRLDVKDFFPSVRHGELEAALTNQGVSDVAKTLALSALKTPTGSAPGPNNIGVPQGLSISGALAQIYMISFDERANSSQFPFFRYVDDILIIAPRAKVHSELSRVQRALGRIGLRAHPLNAIGKTQITPIAEGVDYLGYRIAKGQPICIRASSYNRMFANLMKVFTDFRYRKAIERFVFRLNLKITGCIVDSKRRGWLMFFSRTEQLSQLAYLDSFLLEKLGKYPELKRHRNRIKTFIKSYHEINFRINETNYIPNFDSYDIAQKSEVIYILTGQPITEIMTRSPEIIEREFSRLISKEVQELELDVGRVS